MSIPFLDVKAGYEELRDDLDRAAARVMQSGWYIMGPEVETFERAFAAYCGAPHCIGVGNGLDALHLVLRALHIGPGDEVIVPANTFIATWLAVSLVGARPVPVEPDETTHTMSPQAVEDAVTVRTRAVIPVHLYGRPADMDALADIGRRRGLHVIEDAAQAHGARWRGRPAGSLGRAAAFSFYPGKNLGAFGDSGAIVTADDDLAAQLRRLRNYGSTKKYHHDVQGVNSRLDPLQAALLAVKLTHLDDWNARRRQVATVYLDRLRDVPGLVLPPADDDAQTSWHLFVIRHPRRDALAARLKVAGIETIVHYPIPPHLAPAYRDLGYKTGSFPMTEVLAQTVLSLPIGPHLHPQAAEQVVECLLEAVSGR
jgi:dTDP-3-amino-3,4,6-trideoxy-alpha-D-glucose transaminase